MINGNFKIVSLKTLLISLIVNPAIGRLAVDWMYCIFVAFENLRDSYVLSTRGLL